jgi:tetratricopeptide (TPR) repeat protein
MKTIGGVAVGALCAALAWTGVHASGGNPMRDAQQQTAPEPEKTPEQEAMDHYNAGVAMREKATKLEKELAAAKTDAEKQKIQGKVAKQYERATAEFTSAVQKNNKFHEAWSDLGYVLRKSGRYEDALDSYDEALKLNPRYAPAIEYRAEAFLGLNQVEEAKTAYVDLFGKDRQQADQLLRAMEKWIEARRADPKGVDPAVVDSFAKWVGERSEIASNTPSVSQLRDRSW